MNAFHQHHKVHQKHISRLKRQMRQLKNEMDFIEILSNFWPLPNMIAKVERMEWQMLQLNRQYEQYTRALVS